MATTRSLFPHEPRSHGPRYVVLAKTSNQNQVPAACSSERMNGSDGEDHLSSAEGKDTELLVEIVPERSKLGFKNPWEWYQNCLLRRPLCTQMVTSTVLWSLGDMIAQTLSMAMPDQANLNSTAGSPASFPVKDDLTKNNDNLDWRRVAASGSFGGAFVGPTGHYWYQFLEYACTSKLKLEANSGRFVGAKLCADTLLFGPLHLLVFFFFMNLAAGKTLLQFKQDLHRDYFFTLLTEGVMWTCVQVLAEVANGSWRHDFWPLTSITKAAISSLRFPIHETDDHLELAQGQFELHKFLNKLCLNPKAVVAEKTLPFQFK